MGIKRNEILDLINPDDLSPSLFYWNDLLNFFTNPDIKPHLDTYDVQLLCDEVERCRTFWNMDKIEMITIIKNGKEMKIKTVKIGLDVKKEEITGNIYAYLAELQLQDEEQEFDDAKEVVMSDPIPEPMPAALPMVAAPV